MNKEALQQMNTLKTQNTKHVYFTSKSGRNDLENSVAWRITLLIDSLIGYITLIP